MQVCVSCTLKYVLLRYHFCKIACSRIFLYKAGKLCSNFLNEIFFEKKSLSCCRIYTKHFTFVSRKQLCERIIWFYLVRAEVVLWWHCLIFFASQTSAFLPEKITQPCRGHPRQGCVINLQMKNDLMCDDITLNTVLSIA